jgi:hypothetical protein
MIAVVTFYLHCLSCLRGLYEFKNLVVTGTAASESLFYFQKQDLPRLVCFFQNPDVNFIV